MHKTICESFAQSTTHFFDLAYAEVDLKQELLRDGDARLVRQGMASGKAVPWQKQTESCCDNLFSRCLENSIELEYL